MAKYEEWIHMHNADGLGYALSKQITSLIAIETAYGTFQLDAELKEKVEKVLRPVLQRRLAKLERAAGVIRRPFSDLDPVQQDQARAMFFNAAVNDGYLYELQNDRVFCRNQA